MNDKKLLIGIIFITAVILTGAVFALSRTSSPAALEKVAGVKVEVSEVDFDFKDIPYSGGNVTHEYPVKNIGEKELKIANMSTSCMCTTVALQTGKEKSPEFGMPGHSSPSSEWVGTLQPGEEGKMVVTFDPAAHGPAGVGPVSRFVSFETNDPDHPYVELTFAGNVVKN
ncbi:MAG: DUF1573 domain-containing protein [Armatimonadetes bacterium]|nr:MAG: DUF1573 domain-containing protein [Armatimonadota bacterium]